MVPVSAYFWSIPTWRVRRHAWSQLTFEHSHPVTGVVHTNNISHMEAARVSRQFIWFSHTPVIPSSPTGFTSGQLLYVPFSQYTHTLRAGKPVGTKRGAQRQ